MYGNMNGNMRESRKTADSCAAGMTGSDKKDRRGTRAGRSSRYLALFLAAVLTLSFTLAGCGKSGKDKADTESSDKTTSGSKKPGSTAGGSDAESEKLTEAADDSEKTETVVKKLTDSDFDLHATLRLSRHITGKSEEVWRIPQPATHKESKQAQGGCFDGRYYYQVYDKIVAYGKEYENEDVVVKFDTQTGQVVAESAPLAMNHANDMTYNSKTGEIIVCNCMGRKDKITRLRASDLAFISEDTIQLELDGIDYCPSRDQYACLLGGGQRMAIMDANFRQVGDRLDPTTLTSGWTTQGICCDDEFIYCSLYNPSAITVYEWSGAYVCTIMLPVANNSGEIENLTVIGHDIYMGIGAGQVSVHKMTELEVEY